MGVGNTTTSSAVISALTGTRVEDVGAEVQALQMKDLKRRLVLLKKQ